MNNNILRVVTRPYLVLLITVLISFISWSISTPFMREGYIVKENLTFNTILLLSAWYLPLILFSYFGYRLGRMIKVNRTFDSVPNKQYFILFSLIGYLGVFVTLLSIGSGYGQIIGWILNGEANNLKKMLYDSYSVGPHSLRYVVIVSSAISLFQIMKYRKINWFDIFNLLSLLIVSLISSRLALILCLVITICLTIRYNVVVRRYIYLIAMVFTFLLLTLFNYSRNSNFYKDYFNIDNPIIMNISEMKTYIGSPFQAAVGVTNHFEHFLWTSNNSFKDVIFYMVPSYLRGILNVGGSHESSYREFVDIENGLTTNSSFVSLVDHIGVYSFFTMIVVVFFASIIIGHLSKYKSYINIISFILIYCFAEIWRTYLFNEGIIHMTILIIVLSFTFLYLYNQFPVRSGYKSE
ncbi:hypothetical protein ABES25_16770 [Bacillus gobiensis]|uniref:hypothetical protein n=1 Tax=Bacillus gobiensis TaxID=1441095 RepID=UPI003D23DECF